MARERQVGGRRLGGGQEGRVIALQGTFDNEGKWAAWTERGGEQNAVDVHTAGTSEPGGQGG
eukprot:758485-Hanusia_phi.AAC.5